MKTIAKKQKQLEREHEEYGWFGLVRLEDIYDFECFLQGRGWKACIAEGSCLMWVQRSGCSIVVTWDAEHRKTLTSRHGMVLWYDYQIFGRDKWF